MTKRELTGEAVDQIQARRHRNINADENDHRQIIRIHRAHHLGEPNKDCKNKKKCKLRFHLKDKNTMGIICLLELPFETDKNFTLKVALSSLPKYLWPPSGKNIFPAQD